MKLLLGTILLVASFGAMAACSASSPGDCKDKASCEGLSSSGKPAKWDGSACLLSSAEKSNSDCDQINGSTGEKVAQPGSGDPKKDGSAGMQK